VKNYKLKIVDAPNPNLLLLSLLTSFKIPVSSQFESCASEHL